MFLNIRHHNRFPLRTGLLYRKDIYKNKTEDKVFIFSGLDLRPHLVRGSPDFLGELLFIHNVDSSLSLTPSKSADCCVQYTIRAKIFQIKRICLDTFQRNFLQKSSPGPPESLCSPKELFHFLLLHMFFVLVIFLHPVQHDRTECGEDHENRPYPGMGGIPGFGLSLSS